MSQNGQTHFKNLAANTARFLKCVWLFWDNIHLRVKDQKKLIQTKSKTSEDKTGLIPQLNYKESVNFLSKIVYLSKRKQGQRGCCFSVSHFWSVCFQHSSWWDKAGFMLVKGFPYINILNRNPCDSYNLWNEICWCWIIIDN